MSIRVAGKAQELAADIGSALDDPTLSDEAEHHSLAAAEAVDGNLNQSQFWAALVSLVICTAAEFRFRSTAMTSCFLWLLMQFAEWPPECPSEARRTVAVKWLGTSLCRLHCTSADGNGANVSSRC